MFKAYVLCEKNARHGAGAVVSETDDRFRLLSGIVGVLIRSKASWGREKTGPIQRIQTPKKKEKLSSTHESKFTIESESRTEADVQSTDCSVDACMHMIRSAADLEECSACFV